MEEKDMQKLIAAMKEVFPTAEMITRGFQKTAEDFTAVHTQLDKIEKRLYGIETRIPENALTRLEQLEQDVKDIKAAIGMSA